MTENLFKGFDNIYIDKGIKLKTISIIIIILSFIIFIGYNVYGSYQIKKSNSNWIEEPYCEQWNYFIKDNIILNCPSNSFSNCEDSVDEKNRWNRKCTCEPENFTVNAYCSYKQSRLKYIGGIEIEN